MQLAKKAFPSLGDKDRDRLLKGRFFQALLPKWQRKVGAPKLEESFAALYERARVCERHDPQYQRPSKGSRESSNKARNTDSHKQQDSSETPTQGAYQPQKRQSSIKCFGCQELGHFKRNCPKRQRDRSEAPGSTSQQDRTPPLGSTPKPTQASNAAIEAKPALTGDALLSTLSDDQLETVLRQRKCCKEQSLLCTADGQVGTVSAQGSPSAVGPTLELDVCIEGVQVAAMIDTGAQSSIISRSFLHSIGRHLRRQGKQVPKLEPASVTLYGKDGAAGKHELNVTAQVTLSVSAGGISQHRLFSLYNQTAVKIVLSA